MTLHGSIFAPACHRAWFPFTELWLCVCVIKHLPGSRSYDRNRQIHTLQDVARLQKLPCDHPAILLLGKRPISSYSWSSIHPWLSLLVSKVCKLVWGFHHIHSDAHMAAACDWLAERGCIWHDKRISSFLIFLAHLEVATADLQFILHILCACIHFNKYILSKANTVCSSQNDWTCQSALYPSIISLFCRRKIPRIQKYCNLVWQRHPQTVCRFVSAISSAEHPSDLDKFAALNGCSTGSTRWSLPECQWPQHCKHCADKHEELKNSNF